MKKIINFIIKILKSKYTIFLVAFLLMLISTLNIDLLAGSGDAHETWHVIKTFFDNEPYGSYVMYKGIYAFIPSIISYYVAQIIPISEFLLLKIIGDLAFAYIVVIGVPKIIEYLFDYKIKFWQNYLFILITFILERGVFYFLSVDYMSFAFLLITIIQIIKLTKDKADNNVRKIQYFLCGLTAGVGVCLSGQYSISTYLLIIYLIICIIKKCKKNIKLLLILIVLFSFGFSITKGINVYYLETVVEEAKTKGYSIPSGEDWIIHGLSHNLLSLNYPKLLDDNLSLSLAKNDDEKGFNIIMNDKDFYYPKKYISLIFQYPVTFIVRWTERLFLGLVNDPLNSWPLSFSSTSLIIGFMACCLYLMWFYIKNNLKNFKELFSLKSFIFYSFLFSALVPTFGHVENRYYVACRVMLIAIFALSPLLKNFVNEIKNKKIQWKKINMECITCFIFVIICLVVYFALYQSAGINVEIFKNLN